MAWGARSGLKLFFEKLRNFMLLGLNGLGSPFGIETSILLHLPSMLSPG